MTEVFHRMDLDGNNVISRTEFDFFQERTSGEVCDDDTWKVIQGTWYADFKRAVNLFDLLRTSS